MLRGEVGAGRLGSVLEGGVRGSRNEALAEVRIGATTWNGTSGGGLSGPNEGCAAVESRGMAVDGDRSGEIGKMGGNGAEPGSQGRQGGWTWGVRPIRDA